MTPFDVYAYVLAVSLLTFIGGFAMGAIFITCRDCN